MNVLNRHQTFADHVRQGFEQRIQTFGQVDDVDANWGFRSFTQSYSGHKSMICEAEPTHPDLRRFNKKGLFGIILKKTTTLV